MPSTLIAALLYVFLLIPGFVFKARFEAHRPRQTRSIFSETVQVVFASSFSLAGVLLLGLGLSLFFPQVATASAEFMYAPNTALLVHPRLVAVVLVGILLLATLLAWAISGEAAYSKWSNRKWLRSSSTSVVPNSSGWGQVLADAGESTEVFVGVQLQSGIWLQGVHRHHSDVVEDTGDRAMILQEPLHIRYPGGKLRPFNDFQQLVVQASEIDFVVTCLRACAPAASLSADPSSANVGNP